MGGLRERPQRVHLAPQRIVRDVLRAAPSCLRHGPPQGQDPGTADGEITARGRVAGRTVDASAEEPPYEVESDASGRSAVHRPEALRRRRRST
ncbi:hypervirulence associated TUDOR domain-containing protein [Streptomyces erythrochromogenes]|uniref:DUF2945 domain-containing protein n=1 Tax=Streptomyces erythrochromogenes TaxID=285574 RepID=UPI00382F70C8